MIYLIVDITVDLPSPSEFCVILLESWLVTLSSSAPKSGLADCSSGSHKTRNHVRSREWANLPSSSFCRTWVRGRQRFNVLFACSVIVLLWWWSNIQSKTRGVFVGWTNGWWSWEFWFCHNQCLVSFGLCNRELQTWRTKGEQINFGDP